MARRLVSTLFGVVTVAGCFGSGMESASHRTGQNPRSDGVIDTATRDTGCPSTDLRIVAETGRRYVNETSFRFVVEGCGERFGYVERCEIGSAGPQSVAVNDSLACSFLLVTRLQLRPPTPATQAEPDASVL